MAKKGRVVIIRELCKGCYLCIRACPMKVLEKDIELNSMGVYPVKPGHLEKSVLKTLNIWEKLRDAF